MSSVRTAVETLVLKATVNLPERVQRALLRRPVVLDGQTLAAETQMLMTLQKISGQPGLAMMPDLVTSREVVDTHGRMVAGKQPIGALRDLVVEGAEGPRAA